MPIELPDPRRPRRKTPEGRYEDPNGRNHTWLTVGVLSAGVVTAQRPRAIEYFTAEKGAEAPPVSR